MIAIFDEILVFRVLMDIIRPPRAPWGPLDSGLMRNENEGLYSPNFLKVLKGHKKMASLF